VATATCLACLALAWIVFHSREPQPTVGALLYASAWSNATYLGIPILTAVIGNHATRYAVLYDILALTPLLFTVGSVIGIVYGDKGHRPRRAGRTRAILPVPPVVAAVAGIIANTLHVNLPTALADALSVASSLVAPLMLVSIGMALRPPRMAAMRRIAPAVGITLVVSPVVAWIVGRNLLGMDAESVLAVTLEAGMPSMILPMVFAERYGLDTQTLAEAIVVSTVVSALTLPVIAILVATP
jgi:predicted permease